MSARERLVDVSDLDPPEPLIATLEAAEALAPGEYLRMRHRRDPLLLYPELSVRGLTHRVLRVAPGEFEMLIWRAADDEAGEACLRIAPP